MFRPAPSACAGRPSAPSGRRYVTRSSTQVPRASSVDASTKRWRCSQRANGPRAARRRIGGAGRTRDEDAPRCAGPRGDAEVEHAARRQRRGRRPLPPERTEARSRREVLRVREEREHLRARPRQPQPALEHVVGHISGVSSAGAPRRSNARVPRADVGRRPLDPIQRLAKIARCSRSSLRLVASARRSPPLSWPCCSCAVGSTSGNPSAGRASACSAFPGLGTDLFVSTEAPTSDRVHHSVQCRLILQAATARHRHVGARVYARERLHATQIDRRRRASTLGVLLVMTRGSWRTIAHLELHPGISSCSSRSSAGAPTRSTASASSPSTNPCSPPPRPTCSAPSCSGP